jgi:glycogen debranching enzyme
MADTEILPRPIGEAVEVRPEEHYIEADRSLVDRPLRTLKHGDLFGVFSIDGDIGAAGKGPEGLFFRDTRFLSRLELRIGGAWPLLLDSAVAQDNAALLVDLTNADLHDGADGVALPRSTLFANRWKFLFGQSCYERFAFRNHGMSRTGFGVDLNFGSDFADLFEVRGEQRAVRGAIAAELVSDSEVRLTYSGLDGQIRTTSLCFDPVPDRLTVQSAGWDVALDADERIALTVEVACSMAGEAPLPRRNLTAAYRDLRRQGRRQSAMLGRLTSSNPLFNEMLRRSAVDLDMLLTETGRGLYPYAGIPWYSTIFGRDGIITAMMILAEAPEVALGVLRTLAALQATGMDDAADAQPGKILHETRSGEMAILGEVPFRLYYGSVDSTPLFVMLAADYYARSGDIETIREIWPNIEAAIGWMDSHGDMDGDGFVEYGRRTDQGLVNQGWKDSHDAIFHADGSLAEGPIALCEVQAYVFAAKKGAARLARALGDETRALHWEAEAEILRARFEESFWLEDLQTYALALDGKKAPCRVRASNAGHCLFAGIASPERAAAVARQLSGPAFFSGWGIRTVAVGEARYNPMSYHNGSVWPHDNALIALGMARYGHHAEAARALEGLYAVATFDELRRLPELFCGFRRRPGRGPTAYPVACSPQAWAAAAPFALLAACTGLQIDHEKDCVRLNAPMLPRFIDCLSLPGLRIGDSRIGLRLVRHDSDVTVAVSDRQGSARLIILK